MSYETFEKALKQIKREFKEKWIKVLDEVEVVDWCQYLAKYKGWYALVRIDIEYPFKSKWRIIWEQKYITCLPKDLVKGISNVLLH